MRHGVGGHEAAVAKTAQSDAAAIHKRLLLQPTNAVFDVRQLLDAQLPVSSPRRRAIASAGAARVEPEYHEAALGQELIVQARAVPGVAHARSFWTGIGLKPNRVLSVGREVARQ